MERLKDFFECPICFEEMRAGTQIFACTKDHLICNSCLNKGKLSACPQCREDFVKVPPRRHLILEKMASEMSSKGLYFDRI